MALIHKFVEAYGEVNIFLEQFLRVITPNMDKIKVIESVEENICNGECPTLNEQLQHLNSAIAHSDLTVDGAVASMVPTTIIERFCQVVMDQSSELDLALSILVKLAIYGNNKEIMQWVNLQRYLNQLTKSSSSATSDLASQLLQELSRTKNILKTMSVNKFDLPHSKGLATGNNIWSFQIRQLSYLDVGLAWKVWDSALLLSQWIYNYSYLFRDQTVLEIGSGCGPVGVVLAEIEGTKSVTLSDRIDSVLQNIQFNLDLQKKDTTHVKVKLLDWTEEPLPFEAQSFDIIVASDVIYDMTAADNVPRALQHLMSPNGIAVVVLPSHREGISKFESNMKEKGFQSVLSTVGSYSHSEDGSLNFYMFYKNHEPNIPINNQ